MESRVVNDTALRLFRETDNRMGEAMALINIGLDHHDDGRHASVIAAYGRALIILWSLEDWHGCAGVHERIAGVHLNMGPFCWRATTGPRRRPRTPSRTPRPGH